MAPRGGCCLCVDTTLVTSVVFVCSCFPCSILATASRYCVFFFFFNFMQGSWFNKMEGSTEKKKKKRSWSYSQISRGEAQRQGADPTSTHVLLNVRRRSPVHADGTALPDIIWGNLILPPLPLERRSISGHMSTRFVRLFITINCCST